MEELMFLNCSAGEDSWEFLGLQNHCGWCSPKIKRCLLFGRKAMTNLDSILKSRDIALLTKVHIVKTMIFSSSHVWTWELDHKESWLSKSWCLRILVLEKTPESSLDSKEIKPVNPIRNQPWIFIEGLMLKLQLFGHLMQRANSLEKTLMLGKMESKRRRGQQRMRCLDV